MNQAVIAAAFDRWMDRYTEDPEAFEKTAALAEQHLAERLRGETPTYGQRCAALLAEFVEEQATLAEVTNVDSERREFAPVSLKPVI